MSDEEHASRWIIVTVREEELIQELEVRLDLGTKCHAGFLGPGKGTVAAALVRRVRVAGSDVGR